MFRKSCIPMDFARKLMTLAKVLGSHVHGPVKRAFDNTWGAKRGSGVRTAIFIYTTRANPYTYNMFVCVFIY